MQDYAIIFGARVARGRPSPTLEHRIDGALAYGADRPDLIFLPTGGVGEGGEAEAEVVARVLAEAGIPPGRILVEPRGRDTLESVRFCHALLAARGDCRSLVCCTSAYHQPRCALLLRLLGYRVIAAPMPSRPLPPRVHAVQVAKELAATPYDALLLLARRLAGRI
jgi:uncharacterized SAM-binding protein YcdF (DUF218 family)